MPLHLAALSWWQSKMGATVTDRGSVTACFKLWDGGEPCRDRLSSERFASRDYTSASLVPNAWEKVLIDDSVVNVTKTWLIGSLQTVFSEQRFLSCSYYSTKCG